MKQVKIPAAFMRGGTSKAVVFHERDLPRDPAERDRLLLTIMGSPDPYGRQLDGMGGGLSSLSKVCFVGPSTHPDADINYTKAQIQLREARVDYHSNCGNMSSAMGPFAVDEGLVAAPESGPTLVRIHNTNTRKIIHAHFDMDQGRAAVDGDFTLPGVGGTGAPVTLEFLDPGGATTGKLLPTGHITDELDVPGVGRIAVSMIDAANACVFLRARDLGLQGTEMPDELERIPGLLEKLDIIRRTASVAMGITANVEDARKKSVPIIGFVAAPAAARLLTGESIAADSVDLTARMLSNGQPHRALPLTASLCLAVAALIDGTVVNEAAQGMKDGKRLRIAMPSGILVLGAEVARKDGNWHAEQCTLLRTQRRLFDGYVYARAARLQA
jgi:2-methylaconitate cis-trans-isomerase PrpF